MGDQRLQIHESAADETQCLGVLVAVPVLELQVDLVGGEVHEGVGLFGFADADDEDFAAEADRLDGQGQYQNAFLLLRRLTKIAARMELSTPVHSIATLTSMPAAFLTFNAISSGVSFIST